MRSLWESYIMKLVQLFEEKVNPKYLEFKGSQQKRALKKAMKKEIKHFAKMPHDDPEAYPEDWTADIKYKKELAKMGKKLPVSGHTKKYKQMFGEDVDGNEITTQEELANKFYSVIKNEVEKSKYGIELNVGKWRRASGNWKTLEINLEKDGGFAQAVIWKHPGDEPGMTIYRFQQHDISLPSSMRGEGLGGEMIRILAAGYKAVGLKKVPIHMNVNPSFWDAMKKKHKIFEFVTEESSVDTALKAKSEKTGIPVSILKQVWRRGMAAWRTGHRPGVVQNQWALGRVNSFIVGGPARKADEDLWNKYKEGKK